MTRLKSSCLIKKASFEKQIGPVSVQVVNIIINSIPQNAGDSVPMHYRIIKARGTDKHFVRNLHIVGVPSGNVRVELHAVFENSSH
jgi:hypothetical protein